MARLSHTTNLIALAINHKYAERTRLVFMSPTNGTILPVQLRHFGLSAQTRGR